MQITTLNRIINLFIVGVFANILIGLFIYYLANGGFGDGGIETLKKTVDAPGPLIATFVFFSTSILMGVVIDSLSYLLFHKLVRYSIDRPWVIRIFFLTDRKRLRDAFWDKFKQQFLRANKFTNISGGNSEEVDKSMAAALFFHTGKKESIEWVMQHYSFYVLALDYLVTVLPVPLVIPFLSFSCCVKILIAVANFFLIYFLCHQALNKYLYTYEATFRHCTIVLSEEQKKKTARSIL